MFKKIISQLSFSPVTVERLGRYAQVTRQRQRLHGWAIIILGCLLIAQLIPVALDHSPTTSPTANDLIRGGLPSRETALSAYDTNTDSFASIAALFPIDRESITALQPCHSDIDKLPYATGRTPHTGASEGHAYHLVDNAAPIYVQEPAHTAKLTGWCGSTANNDPFMIIAADGNIMVSALPNQPSRESVLSYSHTVNAENAKPGQLVSWQLAVTNTSDTPVTEDISFAIGDIIQYAHITNVSDSGITTDNNHILWPQMQLQPRQQKMLTVAAYIDNPIDATARQAHNSFAYDCRISTTFGDTADTDLQCPLTKQAETLFYQLVHISPLSTLIIYSALFVLNLIAYLSLHLRSKELRIIRRQLNTGGV